MNRIYDVATTLTMPDAPASALTTNLNFADQAQSTAIAECAIFAPMHYESGYGYPLIVWLHGAGDDQRQLRRVMPLVSMRNYVAVAPCGTIHNQTGYRWCQSPAHIDQATGQVFASIETAARRYHIEPSRIFLTGFADGGTMALRIALNHPEHFAGVLSLGGSLPQDHCPLHNLETARGLPILLASGRHAQDYSETQVCHDLRLLHSAGMSVTLRQYPCSDELTEQMLADMDRWIMELICCTTPATNSNG